MVRRMDEVPFDEDSGGESGGRAKGDTNAEEEPEEELLSYRL